MIEHWSFGVGFLKNVTAPHWNGRPGASFLPVREFGCQYSGNGLQWGCSERPARAPQGRTGRHTGDSLLNSTFGSRQGNKAVCYNVVSISQGKAKKQACVVSTGAPIPCPPDSMHKHQWCWSSRSSEAAASGFCPHHSWLARWTPDFSVSLQLRTRRTPSVFLTLGVWDHTPSRTCISEGLLLTSQHYVKLVSCLTQGTEGSPGLFRCPDKFTLRCILFSVLLGTPRALNYCLLKATAAFLNLKLLSVFPARTLCPLRLNVCSAVK